MIFFFFFFDLEVSDPKAITQVFKATLFSLVFFIYLVTVCSSAAILLTIMHFRPSSTFLALFTAL